MISSRTVLEIAITVWIFVVLIYLAHTSISHRTHDFSGQWEYSKIIAKEHRFPLPYEGGQTYNPPLYYLINSFIASRSLISDEADKIVHVHYVRFLSAIYGVVAILIIYLFLKRIDISPLSRLLVLLFTATTPKFVFLFSSYNNDSLAVMFSLIILFLAYKLCENWSWRNAVFLFIASTAGLYTKYTIMFCIISVAVFCLKNLLKWQLPQKEHLRILGILLLSIVLFFPWMWFHNHGKSNKIFNPAEAVKTLSTVVKIPVLQYSRHEWDEPWVHPTKNRDYFSFAFVTSIIGEYKFKKPHVFFTWLILWIHLVVYFLAFYEISASKITRQAGVLILLSLLIHLFNAACFKTHVLGSNMDYRYIAWDWLPWSVLYASAMLSSSGNRWRFWGFKPLLIIGVVLHIYLLVTVKGG